MERDLERLTERRFDLFVIGAGIAGACVGRDAALRGLKVALIDGSDFGSGVSENSLKIVHGGLRYLQQLDLRRVRRSVRERSIWLRIAPHLVEPQGFLVPTRGSGVRSRPVLGAALAANAAFSFDRNRGVQPDRHLPGNRLIGAAECRELLPELRDTDLTGGALFYDGIIYSSERLVLEVVMGAEAAGAVVANHVRFVGPAEKTAKGWTLRLRDELRDVQLEARTMHVAIAAGPGTPAISSEFRGRRVPPRFRWSLGLNLLLQRPPPALAFGLPTRPAASGRSRLLFFVPWRDHTMVGTAHYPFAGDRLERAPALDDRVACFVREANSTGVRPQILEEEVLRVQAGLLPARGAGEEVTVLEKDPFEEAPEGVFALIATKFTTARIAAERLVDACARRLGERRPSAAARTPLPGTPSGSVRELLSTAGREHGGELDMETLEHLVRSYGTAYRDVLAARGALADWDARLVRGTPVIRAQLQYAVESEMALTAEDLLDRRTEVGARGLVDAEALRSARAILAASASGRG